MKRSRRRPDIEPEEASPEAAREVAVRLLARREHSAQELRHKLTARGIPEDTAEAVLRALSQEGLQSDVRFAESYARTRSERGYGPVRIRAELRQRGVGDGLIDLHPGDGEWLQRAEGARRKRFGSALPSEWADRARQARFLQYRGFCAEHIRTLLDPAGG